MTRLILALAAGLPSPAASAASVSSTTLLLPQIVIQAPAGVQAKLQAFDQERDEVLLPKLGATSFALSSAAIQALPQGDHTPIDKVVLQAPGVSYDTAISNPDFHVRNEYANTQTRINGVMLPEGVSALGPLLDTGFIGKLDLVDGALPAQYGLRTAGVLDLTTKDDMPAGLTADMYGGSFNTLSPTLTLSGHDARTQYFVTTRYFRSDLGLESATSSAQPYHDATDQGRFFGYVSHLVGDSSRLSFMSGGSVMQFQIPNQPGQTPLGDFGPAAYDSLSLNEKERDNFLFGILALQTKTDDFDSQVSVFSRYATVHFIPDVFGDLVFNDVASDVRRDSLLDGVQFDGSERLSEAHTLRFGLDAAAEQTQVTNDSTLMLGSPGATTGGPISVTDSDSKLGWNLGAYVQDEWALTERLTLNLGLRFDQLYQFVDANQVSPRAALVDKLTDETTLHAGYARYFTPPMQAQATPTNLALFANTVQAPAVAGDDPVRPERAHYFDVGVDQTILPGWTAGADTYYKIATDQIDDGQFGQAVVLTQFNYDRGYSEGFELKSRYQTGGLALYGNFSANQTMAKQVVSNEYLFTDPDEFAYIANHYHYTDDCQVFSASYGVSYHWGKAQATLDGIYGSGLRSGFANVDHVAPYEVFNLGVSREFDWGWQGRPLTARLAVVNLFDATYLLRSGTGVGEFAPQYGARRGIYGGVSQRL